MSITTAKVVLLLSVAFLLLPFDLKSQSEPGKNRDPQFKSPSTVSVPKILLKKDLMNYLIGTKWTWVWKQGQKTTSITFHEDRTASTPYWTATFKVIDLTTIQLNLDNQFAILTFDRDYLAYKGKDFDRKSTVMGVRQK